MRSMKWVASAMVLGTFLVGTASASTNYVWRDCPGPTHNGDSWATAYTNLHDAINDTETEIWVAEGIYVPDATDSSVFFQMEDGVTWYGGFTTGMQTRAERNWTNHLTILSGEINTAADTDNSYRIIVGADNGTLDGFVISNGYGFAADPGDRAGGLYAVGNAVTVRNCTFIDCVGNMHGGAVYVSTDSSTFENCTFIHNTSDHNGGAVCASAAGAAVITFTNCTFIGNHSVGYGGGVASYDNVAILGCTFVGNSTETLAQNGGGGVGLGTSGDVTVRDCVFVDNYSPKYGGGLGAYSGATLHPTIEDCTFAGNRGDVRGGAVHLENVGTEVVKNCLFVGNQSTNEGAGGALSAYTGVDGQIRNCTFAFNRATRWGGAVYMGNGSDPTFENCIMWGNSEDGGNGDNIWMGTAGDTLTLNYCDLQGGTNAPSVDGNGDLVAVSDLDVNPFFAGGSTGDWSANGSYDPYAGKTTLTDAGISWTTNSLAGKFVNPDTNQWLQFYIVGNVSSTMTVWGDASGIGLNTKPYQIYDYHLQSKAGRWDPGDGGGAGGWVTDGEHSDCIDAGTNYVACVEPAPNGDTINMGAYGNTAEASLSLGPAAAGTVIFIR